MPDGATIAAQRLHNQRITHAVPSGPANVVAWFGAMQAQEYGPAKWGLGLRLARATTDAAIDRAINAGRILRTHVLRPTWHFVRPADIRWMLELTAPRIQRAMGTYRRQIGLEPGMMVRAAVIIERVLGNGPCLTRAELGAHLERAGLPVAPLPLVHFAMHAELEGLICSGPRRGKQLTYALIADRAAKARRLSRDEGLAELGRRFLRSHAPATIRDFVWWSGLRTTEAKRAFEMNGARSRDVDGLMYWSTSAYRRRKPRRGRIDLLPIYDEYLVAYRDRVAVPHAAYLFGAAWHSLVINGQVTGTWRTASHAGGVRLDVTLLRRLTSAERRGLTAVVSRYSAFLGTPISLSIT